MTTVDEILCRYNGIIVDVDGTLYYQRGVRFFMALKLLFYVIATPSKFKYLLALLRLRQLRETDIGAVMSLDEQVNKVSRCYGLAENEFMLFINRWLFEEPLTYIKIFKNSIALDLVKKMIQKRKKVLFYSDYPCDDKLEALGVEGGQRLYPGKMGIVKLKPSKESINIVMREISLNRVDVIYIGDRYEKDGAAAKTVGIEFLDIRNLGD
jgi:FMN phosphatase YigB (HAD superfamily)